MSVANVGTGLSINSRLPLVHFWYIFERMVFRKFRKEDGTDRLSRKLVFSKIGFLRNRASSFGDLSRKPIFETTEFHVCCDAFCVQGYQRASRALPQCYLRASRAFSQDYQRALRALSQCYLRASRALSQGYLRAPRALPQCDLQFDILKVHF